MSQDGLLLKAGDKPASDVMPLLPQALRLDPDCTLRSFFAMLIRYPDLQKLSGFLPAAVKEAESCPASGCRCDDIAALVLGKTMELIGFPGEPRAELYLWLRGLEPRTLEAHTPGAGMNAALEGGGGWPLELLLEADREIRFIPLQILLDTPLMSSGLKHVVLGDVDRKLFCESRFSLFEVVDGLAWELGFQGGNQQCSLGR